MSSCCTTDDSNAADCPTCGHLGPIVGAAPVRPHLPTAVDGDWQFCSNDECTVLYHLDGNTVDAESAITQVGGKATDKPTPVCFCFAHTVDALRSDLADHDGISQIKAEIKTAVAEGFCACQHLNPSGQCCLAEVHRTLKILTQPTQS